MNHSHILYDSDPHFKIDPISRKITKEPSAKTTIIQHDHNSERFTFEMPRYVEGHDMSESNIVEIHYLNVESGGKNVKAGVYSVEDLHIKDDDENTVVCSWLVPSNATQFVGQLQFLVRFSCVSEDTGKIEYVWNTAVYSGISVSTGIYNAESPSDNPVPPFNFVTTINGDILKFFVGTQAQYDALDNEDKEGLFAIITDDKTKEEIFAAIVAMQTELSEFSAGTRAVANATHATHATTADSAVEADHATTADKATTLLKTRVQPPLTDFGFYHICVRDSDGYIDFGFVNFDKARTFGGLVWSAMPGYLYKIEISASGAITIYRSQTQVNGVIGAFTDVTSNFPNIYVEKVNFK